MNDFELPPIPPPEVPPIPPAPTSAEQLGDGQVYHVVPGAVLAVDATLRDEFAAAALTGLLAWSPVEAETQLVPLAAARQAYAMADAMLYARAQGPQWFPSPKPNPAPAESPLPPTDVNDVPW